MTSAPIVPLRYVAKIDPSKSEIKHLPDDLEVDFIPMEAVGHGGLLHPVETRRLGEVRDGYTYLKSGDVSFAKISPSFQNRKGGRAVGLTNDLAFATTELTVLRPEPAVDARFLQFVVESEPFIQHGAATLHGVAGQQRVDLSRIAAFPVWLPRIDVQRRIADMLDIETARIDAIIEQNECLINLLWQRYRASRQGQLAGGFKLGSERATHWAESNGWRVAPLWLVSQNHDSRRIPINAEVRGSRQGPYPYWGANTVQDYVDDWLFEGPHVLVGEDGAPFFVDNRDAAWVADGRFWVNNHAHVLEAVEVDPMWLAECLNIVDFSLFVSGSTRDKLTQEALNRIPVPVPPLAQQSEIIRDIRRARELASSLTDQCRAQQDLLQLRRKALITAAVTGQLEV